VLGNEGRPDGVVVTTAWRSFLQALKDLGKAQPGDKTLIDAVEPFVLTLEAEVESVGLATAWKQAADVATQAAKDTAALTPRVGRARPLAARSVGTPDPGATSFALCVRTVADVVVDCT
jgi:dihydroxyacetone kinase